MKTRKLSYIVTIEVPDDNTPAKLYGDHMRHYLNSNLLLAPASVCKIMTQRQPNGRSTLRGF